MSHLDYPDAAALDARVRLHEQCSINSYGWHRWVMDQTIPHLRGQILEVGTGPAYLWIENTHRLPTDIHLTLSDRSRGMLRDSSEEVTIPEVEVDWVECGAEDLPFASATFDLVIANHMLFLLQHPEQAVGSLARVLRPDGFFCATTNHRDHLLDLIDLLIEISSKHFAHLKQGERARQRERFNFISGAELLMPHFDEIELVTYADGLLVDDASVLAPWLDFWARPVLAKTERTNLLEILTKRIAREGPLRIRKNSGMFKATLTM
jgi:ubiquinone/menaquinone biosynthesis C-methylase UbiE